MAWRKGHIFLPSDVPWVVAISGTIRDADGEHAAQYIF
jgi:hypothetical protein